MPFLMLPLMIRTLPQRLLCEKDSPPLAGVIAWLDRRHCPCRRSRFHKPRVLLALLLTLPPMAAAQPMPSVIGERVTKQAWSDPISALGTLRADESIVLASSVTDIITQIGFTDSQDVKAGDLLIQLDDREEQAQLRAAQARVDERRNAVERATQLADRNLSARADLEDNLARLRQAQAETEALEAELSNYSLRAPFDGQVGFRDVSLGSLVTPGTALVTLDKLDTVTLDFSVPEVFLATLEKGLVVEATTAAYPDRSFTGQVTSIAPRIDAQTRSVQVRASLANPDTLLRPGMLMEVSLARSPRQAVVINEAALKPEGERQLVMLIQSTEQGHRLAQRQVTLGARRRGEVEILDGLEPGHLVAIHGLQRVRDGQAVRLLGIRDANTSIPELLAQDR